METTRAFARAQLAESGDEADAIAGHLRHVIAWIQEITVGLHGPAEAHWVEALDQEWADVRVAVRRALDADDADAVIDIVTHLADEAFWRRSEAFDWIQAAFARYGNMSGPHQHELIGAASWVAWVLLDVPTAVELAERALALDPSPASALCCLPECGAIGAYIYSGRPGEAAELIRRVIPIVEERGDTWYHAHMEGNLALALALAGDFDGAEDAARRVISVAQGTGNPTINAYATFTEGIVLMARHELARAAQQFDRARAFGSEVRNTWITMSCASGVAHDPGLEPEVALANTVDIIDEQQRSGWTIHAWTWAWFLPAMLQALGRVDEAALAVGACSRSGIQPMYTTLPDELAVLPEVGDDRLKVRYQQGTRLSLPDITRMAAGASPLPPL